MFEIKDESTEDNQTNESVLQSRFKVSSYWNNQSSEWKSMEKSNKLIPIIKFHNKNSEIKCDSLSPRISNLKSDASNQKPKSILNFGLRRRNILYSS